MALLALLAGTGFITAAAQSVRIVTTVAGLTRPVYGNGGPAAQATINYSDALVADSAGNLYLADTLDHQIRKIDAATGIVTAVAGTGQQGYSGDGQLAINAQLNFPEDVAVDAAGNVYIADTNNEVIRKVSAATGVITTIAGTPYTYGYSGENSAATKAFLNNPSGVAVDSSGNVYIADSLNFIVRKVTAATGIITTVAGIPDRIGVSGTGDGGPATSAMLGAAEGVAFDPSGNFYIADGSNCVVRKVTAATGIITSYAGNNTCRYSGDNGPATSAGLGQFSHTSLDSAGNLYLADSLYNVIRKVTASTGIITTIAGNGTFGFSGDGGLATNAELSAPEEAAPAGSGAIYIADRNNLRIREVSAAGIISTFAGNGMIGPLPGGVPATSAPLGLSGYRWYTSIAADSAGNIYFADGLSNAVRKVTPAGVISTIAGNGEEGYSGDGGPATDAEFYNPSGLAFDSQGNLYISDYGNRVVRKVNASTGIISTYAGTYSQPDSGTYLKVTGDGGPATSAGLPQPTGLVFDSSGNLYIVEAEQCVVRKVTPAGIISSFAGQATSCRNLDQTGGDGGQAASAQLSVFAGSIATDSQGDLYIGDYDTVRKVTAATGIITTTAGVYGQFGDSGDGGAAASANLSQIYGLAIDSAGNLYIADDPAIRAVTTAGIISTAAGQDLEWGYSGDGGLATSALISPEGIGTDNSGNVYFTDLRGDRIRKVSTATTTQPDADTPVFDPSPGDFSSAPAVTITTTTPGAQIFYTLDGSTPNPGTSALYTGPIQLVAPVTLSAIAIAPGYSTSAAATGLYATGQGSPAPAITLSPATLTFSSEGVGSTSAAQTITLTNSGNAALSIASIAASGNFAETNTCGTSVAASATCTISVTFSPTAGGALTGTLTLTDNASNSPQTVSLSGTGAGVSIATASTGMTVNSAGGSATATIQVSSTGSFSGMVNLTCSVAYQGSGTAQDVPTCSLNPAQEQVSSGTPVSATLTVNTTSSSGSARLDHPWLPFGGGALAALFFFGGVPRRRWRKLGLLIVLASIAVGATLGCGGGSTTTTGSGTPSNPGTTTGNYMVTVTATSASNATEKMSVTIPLAVQ